MPTPQEQAVINREAQRLQDVRNAEAQRLQDVRNREAQRIQDVRNREAQRLQDARNAEAQRIYNAKRIEAQRLQDALERELKRKGEALPLGPISGAEKRRAARKAKKDKRAAEKALKAEREKRMPRPPQAVKTEGRYAGDVVGGLDVHADALYQAAFESWGPLWTQAKIAVDIASSLSENAAAVKRTLTGVDYDAIRGDYPTVATMLDDLLEWARGQLTGSDEQSEAWSGLFTTMEGMLAPYYASHFATFRESKSELKP